MSNRNVPCVPRAAMLQDTGFPPENVIAGLVSRPGKSADGCSQADAWPHRLHVHTKMLLLASHGSQYRRVGPGVWRMSINRVVSIPSHKLRHERDSWVIASKELRSCITCCRWLFTRARSQNANFGSHRQFWKSSSLGVFFPWLPPSPRTPANASSAFMAPPPPPHTHLLGPMLLPPQWF